LLRNGNTVLKSLREQVYDYLFAQLRQRALDPGSFLDLNEIAARLGVSRTPLRDALIYLEVEGFVELLPRRGVRVKYLDLEEIKNLYQIIGGLEATALLEAADRFTAEDHQRLQDLTDEYRRQLELGSYDGCLATNYQFHDYFLDHCGNALLATLVKAQKRRLYDWPRHTKLVWEWERKNVEEHEKIVALLKAGDKAGASEWLRNVHWSFPVQESFIQPFYSGSAD
jgi:DNA-binding GntR family transcriptional regulator